MDRHETEAELAARMQRVTDQISDAIVEVECTKAEMADLLMAHALMMLVEEHGARKASRSVYLLAMQIAAGQDVEDADVATVEALKKAGAKMI